MIEHGAGTDSSAVSWGAMLSGTNGKLVAIACSLFLFQQFSGINAIVYFSSSVFREAGVGSETLASAAVGLVNVLGTIIAASLMDRAGRKCASAELAALMHQCVTLCAFKRGIQSLLHCWHRTFSYSASLC
jgi:MFS family permease